MLKLFMIIIGGSPRGRNTEQHDVFFGIASNLTELFAAIDAFWPEVDGKWHIDSWREVNYVDGYKITALPVNEVVANQASERLYFINLGGYKPNDMEEYHYKMLVVAPNKLTAISKSKLTTFYKHATFKGATSHIDDKYSIDVDDSYELKNILPKEMKKNYKIIITPADTTEEDMLHIGYLKRK